MKVVTRRQFRQLVVDKMAASREYSKLLSLRQLALERTRAAVSVITDAQNEIERLKKPMSRALRKLTAANIRVANATTKAPRARKGTR